GNSIEEHSHGEDLKRCRALRGILGSQPPLQNFSGECNHQNQRRTEREQNRFASARAQFFNSRRRATGLQGGECRKKSGAESPGQYPGPIDTVESCCVITQRAHRNQRSYKNAVQVAQQRIQQIGYLYPSAIADQRRQQLPIERETSSEKWKYPKTATKIRNCNCRPQRAEQSDHPGQVPAQGGSQRWQYKNCNVGRGSHRIHQVEALGCLQRPTKSVSHYQQWHRTSQNKEGGFSFPEQARRDLQDV